MGLLSVSLFDSHCHLQDMRIVTDIDAVMKRAGAVGIKRIVCCGTSEDDWCEVLLLAKRYRAITPALGIHPWYAAGRSEFWLGRLEELLERDEGIAVGEIGLDHALPQRDDDDQMKLFYEQLSLAARLGRPVSIHCRKAWGSIMQLFRREPGIAAGSVIHSYSGPPELVGELTGYGVSLSFSGAITYTGNRRCREAAALTPVDKLLIETDSPDIVPSGWSGHNEPASLEKVASALAFVRGIGMAEAAERTFANGCAVFDR